MFEAIKRLYEKTNNTLIVKNAVARGWLSTDEYQSITGEKYTE
jgi:hypothetical protein